MLTEREGVGKRRAHHEVRVVDEWRPPLALVGRVLDQWRLPLPTPHFLTGRVRWERESGGEGEGGRKGEGERKREV